MKTKIEYREAITPGITMDFVMSDGSLDRHGTRINPDGWHLDNFKRNPIAFFNHDSDFPVGVWEGVRTVKGQLIGTLKLAAEGTSARIDELVRLAQQGILRAVSVGFRVVKFGENGKSQFDFDETELMECSLVSLGSNTNALAKARALHISPETERLVFGDQASKKRADQDRGGTGDHAPHEPQGNTQERGPPTDRKPIQMDKPISEKIVDTEALLNQARDDLTRAINGDATTEERDECNAAVEALIASLDSLKRSERVLAGQAREGGAPKPTGATAAPAIRRPLGTRKVEPKPGDLIIRSAVVMAQAYIDKTDPIKILEARYGDDEATQTYVRAAIDPAKTTVAGWAQELVNTETVAFMESLKASSVFPSLASAGLALSFGPGRAALKIPSRAATPSISGSFVLEGAPIPVRRLGLTSITLTPQKLGVISFFTRELARLSSPQIESVIREAMQDDTAVTLDTLLLDAVAGSTTRPAGLTNGVTVTAASSAGGFAAIIEDITNLAAPFDTANAGRNLVLIMNPREARYISMTPGPNGVFGWASNILSEFTIIRSTNVTAGSIYMIDAADFVSVAGAPDFDVSEQAVLHAEDTTPAHIGVAGAPNVVAAPTYSMFQTDSIAIRMLMDLTWAMRRTGMVKFITGADWAPVA
jgi:HK97 family phage prohead protease/HK97 family phage major capsid protein